MPAFKEPSFQDRAALAKSAKQKAIDRLKAKPPVNEEEMAKRRAAWEASQLAIAEERAVKAAAVAADKAEKAAIKAAAVAEAEAAAALKAERLRPPSAAEMKAARDARYAARKARN